MASKIFKFIFAVFALISLLSIYYGFSSILHLGLIYGFICMLFITFFQRSSNLKLLSVSLAISIFILEIGLWLFLPHENFSYLNPTRKNSLKNLLHQSVLSSEDIHFYSTQASYSFHYTSNGEFSYRHVYNSLGLREEEPSILTESNKITVLGLGDSFTEGAGAPKDSTWLASLERFDKQHQLKAINGGSISSDILFEYYKLDTKLYDLYQPKKVILSINKTDILDFNENGGLNRYENPDHFIELDSPWWSFFYTFSPSSRYFFHKVLDWDESGCPENSIKKEQESILAIDQTLLQFQKHAIENNYGFYLIIIPLIEEFENETLQLKNLDQFCLTHDISVFNLYNYIIENKIDYRQYYWMKDGHLNPAGYELLGGLVYQQFLESDSF